LGPLYRLDADLQYHTAVGVSPETFLLLLLLHVNGVFYFGGVISFFAHFCCKGKGVRAMAAKTVSRQLST
jgi:hypothetical protein